MHSTTDKTLVRLERVLRDRIRPQIYRPLTNLSVEAWDINGEPVSFVETEAKAIFRPISLGSSWGSPWDTTWFRFRGKRPLVPSATDVDLEIVIDLGWEDHSVGFQCEGLVYSETGTIIKALNPRNRWIALDSIIQSEDEFSFLVEAAANPLLLEVPPFQPIKYGEAPTSFDNKIYTLRQANICLHNREIAAFVLDLEVLAGLAHSLPANSIRRSRIIVALEKALNIADSQNLAATVSKARTVLRPALDSPANATVQHLSAIGHAHIDSAWLWPLRETRRKVIRTLSNVLGLFQENPDFVFAVTSAQQLAWVEQDAPALFEQIKQAVADGRIVPVGGMWVEPDATMPSGESLCRQILYGQEFFRKKFNLRSSIMWLPDSFGYSAALPQLAVQGGMDAFLTQKISWNDTNRFPHHSFWWEGLDGTRLLTHFPPADTYGAEVTAAELQRSSDNYQEKAISDHAVLLFGYGDGGGGPTREMIERAERFRNLEGSPRVTQRTPQDFFADLKSDIAEAGSVWSGELYLELHRGTFTSQVAMKQGNRRIEALLRQVEMEWAEATLRGGEYPYDELEEIWQAALLAQFHDILPGTSISWVHQEISQNYRQLEERLKELFTQAHKINTQSIEICAAAGRAAGAENSEFVGAEFKTNSAADSVTVQIESDGWNFNNSYISVRIDKSGTVSSIVDRKTERELISTDEKFGQLVIMRDEPVTWDAWDIDLAVWDTMTAIEEPEQVRVTQVKQAANIDFVYKFGKSTAEVSYRLANDSPALEISVLLDWQEDEKLLKLLMPLDLNSPLARYETQFGYIQQMVHDNTSWDHAQFERCAHRYIHLLEEGFGVAVINDGSYGYSIDKTDKGVLIGASVVRAPMYPDITCDRGLVHKRWQIFAAQNVGEVLDKAEDFNQVLDVSESKIVRVDSLGATSRISAVKSAQDRSGDTIVRLWEAGGRRTKTTLHLAEVFGDVVITEVNLLEEEIPTDKRTEIRVSGREVQFELRPFQVFSLRIAKR